MSKDEASREASTSHLVSQVHYALRALAEDTLRAHCVTGIQFTVLSVVARHHGLCSADLSRRFHVTPQSMGQLLTALEDRGLLERNEDIGNRRILRVGLTPAGRELVERCAEEIGALERAALAGLDGNQLQSLRSMLRTLIHSLRDDTKSAQR